MLLNLIHEVNEILSQANSAAYRDDLIAVNPEQWARVKLLATLDSSKLDKAFELVQSIYKEGSLEQTSNPANHSMNDVSTNDESISRELLNRLSLSINTFVKQDVDCIIKLAHSDLSEHRQEPTVFSSESLFDIHYYLFDSKDLVNITVSGNFSISDIYKKVCQDAMERRTLVGTIPPIDRIFVRQLTEPNYPKMWTVITDLNSSIAQMDLKDEPILHFDRKTTAISNVYNFHNVNMTGPGAMSSVQAHTGKHVSINSSSPTSTMKAAHVEHTDGCSMASKLDSKFCRYESSITMTDSGKKTYDNDITDETPTKHCSFFTINTGTHSTSKVNCRTKKNACRGLRGLKNLGNTCFMNSSLQCLSNIPNFRDFFLHLNPEEKKLLRSSSPILSLKSSGGPRRLCLTRGELTEAYADLMKELWSSDSGTCDPSPIKSLIGRISNRFSGYNQNDSQEFMCVLLDSLHEDLKSTPGHDRSWDVSLDNKTTSISMSPNSKEELQMLQDKIDRLSNDPTVKDSMLAEPFLQIHMRNGHSFVMQMFQGQIKSTVQCLSCYHYSRTFDPFLFLCLPLSDDRMQKRRLTTNTTGCGPYNNQRSNYPPQYRLSSSQPFTPTFKPSIEQAKIIVFGVLITMDGLIHPIAVCVPKRTSEKSELNNTRINCCNSEESMSSSIKINENASEDDDSDEFCLNSKESPEMKSRCEDKKQDAQDFGLSDNNIDAPSNVEINNVDTGSCSKIDVSDLIAAAEEATIFLKTKSYHAVPRLELLETVCPNSKIRDNCVQDGLKYTYFRKVPTNTNVQRLISDFNEDNVQDPNSDQENWGLDSNNASESRQHFNPPKCNLKIGVVLCQFPPPPKSDVNPMSSASMHAIVTLRLSGSGHLYPFAMSFQSLGMLSAQNRDSRLPVQQTDSTEGSADKLPTASSENSVITLARRGLQCLDFELTARTCEITPVFEDLRNDNSESVDRHSGTYLFAEFAPHSIIQMYNKKKQFLDHQRATILFD